MLHITSFMQNIAKLNKNNNAPLHNRNGLNRNYSFIYDQNSKKYDYIDDADDENDEELKEGYWGYMRDNKADRKQLEPSACNKQTYDGYWGVFKDSHLSEIEIDFASNLNSIAAPSTSPSTCSLSSSINSLSRFKDFCLDDAIDLNQYELSEKNKLEYDYKTSKFKIQARKRDEMKIFIQSLEDRESQFKKEVIKSFDPNLTFHNIDSTNYSTKVKEINFLHFCNKSASVFFSKHKHDEEEKLLKKSTKSMPFSKKSNKMTNSLNNFKNIFNTLTRLHKTINIFSGDLININNETIKINGSEANDLSFINNVHVSMNDLDGFMLSYMYEKTLQEKNPHSNMKFKDSFMNSNKFNLNFYKQKGNVSLCSNIYENCFSKSLNSFDEEIFETETFEKIKKLFGHGNHSTMLFECSNIKIGFMALIDNLVYEKLSNFIRSNSEANSNDYLEVKGGEEINPIEYVDYVSEADRLSKQLRNYGANVVIALTNMESELNEQRLISEAIDIDIVFSSLVENSKDALNSEPSKRKQIVHEKKNNKWIIRSGENLDFLSLVTLRLDELNSNKIIDIAIQKYIVE